MAMKSKCEIVLYDVRALESPIRLCVWGGGGSKGERGEGEKGARGGKGEREGRRRREKRERRGKGAEFVCMYVVW